LKNVLILGIGNDILTDDGIGPRLVQDLQNENFPDGIHFQNAFVGGLEILELIQGYKMVIFIDAIITRDGIPGTVYQFRPEDFRETLHLSNLHDANFITAMHLGKKLNMLLPDKIHIIAVEIVEDRVFSDQFSPEIREKYPTLLESVRKIVFTLIDSNPDFG
jgi:hydrogenase maturation protease